MNELNVFLTTEEVINLLVGCIASEYRVQAVKNMSEPARQYCSDEKSIRNELGTGHRSFLLERDDFTRYPIRLRSIKKGEEVLWYPRAKEGGPAIEVVFFPPFERDGSGRVPCSLISHHKYIINPAGEEEAAGSPIAESFATLARLVAVGARRIKLPSRVAYVSPGD